MKKTCTVAFNCLLILMMTMFGGNSVSHAAEDPGTSQPVVAGRNSLIVYFSQTGTTEGVAMEIQAQTGAQVFELLPETPYVDDYSTLLDIARAERDNQARPAFTGAVEDFGAYDTVFLGYSIWHGSCPMIIHSFLKAYDLSGKTVIPFSTSGSSGIERSVTELREAYPEATVLNGLGLSGSEAVNSGDAVAKWLKGLDLPRAAETLYIHIGDNVLTASLLDNSSAAALADLLSEGPLTIEMRDFQSMEKVGELGASLPTNDEQITTEPGDLILYQGSSFVIYYAPNTWNLTRLGKVDGVTVDELKAALGDGDLRITLSLEP